MHLIIQGITAEPQRVHNLKFIYELLDSYPAQIGMHKVSPPQVSQYQIPNTHQPIVSGFVLLAESHISIHFFPRQSYLNIDVFSCKEFEPQKVLQDLKQRFRLKEVKTYLLERPPSTLSLPEGGFANAPHSRRFCESASCSRG